MKALLASGGAYGLAGAALAAAQFGAMLLFASALCPATFGNLAIFNVLYVVLAMTVGMGLSAYAQRAFFSLADDAYRSLVSTLLKAVALLACVLAVVALLLPERIVSTTSLPRPWLLLALLAATAQVFSQVLLVILQTQQRIAAYLTFAAVQVALVAGSVLTYLAVGDRDGHAALGWLAAPPLAAGVMAAGVLARRGYIVRHWAHAELQSALRYSLPLVPHQVAGWAIAMVDRFIIASSAGLAEAGVYSLAFQIAQGMNLVSTSLNQAYVPLLFSSLAQGTAQRSRTSKLGWTYAAVLVGFAVLFVAALLWIGPRFLAPGYREAMSFVPWLIAGFALLALSRIGANVLMYHGRTAELAIATIASSCVSVALNLYLVPRHGAIAACWTSVAAFLLLLTLTTWRASTFRSR